MIEQARNQREPNEQRVKASAVNQERRAADQKSYLNHGGLAAYDRSQNDRSRHATFGPTRIGGPSA